MRQIINITKQRNQEEKMKPEQNEQIERTEKFLDERWYIANMPDARPQDVSYYNGALKALEMAGYE